MTNLFSQFRAAAPDPAKLFIRTAGGREISYGAMVEQSGRLANALVSLGVAPGERVMVQVEKSAEALLLYLACLRAGAVYAPLNTAYTLAELEYFLGDAEPALVVCSPERQADIAAIAERLGLGRVESLGVDGEGSLMERARGQDAAFEDVERADGDLAAILYTSGTTGRSKGAMLSHANLASNALALRDYWGFTAGDVLLHALPIFHAHGLFVAVNVTLAAGSSMILLPKFEPSEVFRLLPGATVMMGVPTFYVRLLQDERLDAASTAHIRVFISGSAPLLAETHEAWKARTGHAILERYGMTETGMNTSNPLEGERVAGTVGFPLPGVEVRVTEPETGAVLPPETIGMIEVRGPNVFGGYWRMPEKTAAEFRADGFFITGDLGKIDARGYVHILGRGKDLIISGGYNVYPKEVEMELDALPGVVESAVIGLPHPDLGEGVTAVLIAGEGAPSEAEVKAALKARLANYKLPKRVLFMAELPRNAMGKVQKNLLREQYAGLYG